MAQQTNRDAKVARCMEMHGKDGYAVGDAIDLCFQVVIDAATDGTTFAAEMVNGSTTEGDHLTIKPEKDGTWRIADVTFEGTTDEDADGSEADELYNNAAQDVFIGRIKSGNGQDRRTVFDGSHKAANDLWRVSALALDPNDERYKGKDPLALDKCEPISDNSPGRISVGNKHATVNHQGVFIVTIVKVSDDG